MTSGIASMATAVRTRFTCVPPLLSNWTTDPGRIGPATTLAQLRQKLNPRSGAAVYRPRSDSAPLLLRRRDEPGDRSGERERALRARERVERFGDVARHLVHVRARLRDVLRHRLRRPARGRERER